MQSFLKVLRKAEDAFMGLAGLAALGLVCFDVVTRYFFPAYLQDWTGEVTIYLTAAAMLLAGGLLLQGPDVEVELDAPARQFSANGRPDPVGSAYRHGGFVYHQFIVVHVATDGGGHRQHILHVR